MDEQSGKSIEGGIKEEAFDFEEALARTTYGKFNVFVLCMAGICLVGVITETMGMGFIIPVAQCDLQLTLGDKGILNAIGFLGIMTSSHFLGFLADIQGRRSILLWSYILASIATVASSFSTSLWMFIVLRYINGFCLAAPSAVVYVYLGEFHDGRYRSRVLTLSAAFITLGSVLLPVFSWLIVPLDFSFDLGFIVYKPWRLLVASFCLPGLLSCIGLYLLPESPKYLIAQGEEMQALNTLKRMYSVNTGKDPDTFPVKKIILTEENMGAKNTADTKSFISILQFIWRQTMPIFLPPYVLKTLVLCLLQFGSFLVSGGLYLWYPDIINKMTTSDANNLSNTSYTLCTMMGNTSIFIENENSTFYEGTCTDEINTDVFVYTLIISVATAFAYILVAFVMHWIDKKKILLTVLLTSSAAGLCVNVMTTPIFIFLTLLWFIMSCLSIGLTNTFSVDVYPTQYRAMAVSISFMAGRLGAIVGSNLAGFMLEHYCDITFYLFGGILLVCFLVATTLPGKGT